MRTQTVVRTRISCGNARSRTISSLTPLSINFATREHDKFTPGTVDSHVSGARVTPRSVWLAGFSRLYSSVSSTPGVLPAHSLPQESITSAPNERTGVLPTEAECINAILSTKIYIDTQSPRSNDPVKQSDFDLANDLAIEHLLGRLLADGTHPSRKVLEHALALACKAHNNSHIDRLVALHAQYWIRLSEKSIELIGAHYCDTAAFEQCIAFFDNESKNGHLINAASWSALIIALLQHDECATALECLQRVDSMKLKHPVLTLSPKIYYDALVSAADNYNVDALQWLWNRALHQRVLTTIDQGLCTKVLNVCGRHGLPILATEVIRFLASKGVQPKTFHYASLIESYCNAGDVKNAFQILDIMRKEGVSPTPTTASAIVKFMSTELDLIDRAYFTLQDIHAEGGTVDISAFNAVIDASVLRRDVSRAIATYKEHAALKVEPNVETLNSLLAGCVSTYQKDLAINIIKLFSTEHGINADRVSFSRLISVCVLQEDYEDAFKYLEEMKEEGHQPPIEVYSLIVRRCVEMNDPRAKIAYQEMTGWGYQDARTQQLLHRNPNSRRMEPVKDTTTGVLDTLHTMTRSAYWFRPRS